MKSKLTLIMLIAGYLCAQSQTWTWLDEIYLSDARSGLSSTVLDNTIFFSGGQGPNYSYPGIIDIYDIGEEEWTTYEPQTPDRWMASSVSANGMVFIAGGNDYNPNISWDYYSEIDVYTKETDEWSIENLSEARVWMGTITHDNKVFFAGGFNGLESFIYQDVIDIYDTETNTWLDPEYLTVPRGLMGTVAVCGKVFFAGGAIESGQVTDRVDIYDMETGEWTMENLSVARAYVAAVAYEGLVYFAGGTYADNTGSDVIDIYNCEDEEWEEDIETLSEPRIVSAHIVYNALVFTGMFDYLNLTTGTAYYPNGTVDVYYPATGNWDLSVPDLYPASFFNAHTSCNNRVYYAGGSLVGGAKINTVNILEYYPVGTSEDKFQELVVRIYPNPFTTSLRIDYNLQYPGKVNIVVYNNIGEEVEFLKNSYQQQGDQQVIVNTEKLKPGIYFCVLKTNEGVQTTKMIKL